MSKLKKALEKAEEARGTGESPFLAIGPHVGKEAKGRREVNVTYSNTKTVDIDHRTFRKNRIFSLFQESEASDQINVL